MRSVSSEPTPLISLMAHRPITHGPVDGAARTPAPSPRAAAPSGDAAPATVVGIRPRRAGCAATSPTAAERCAASR
jgi:hypothetical protein